MKYIYIVTTITKREPDSITSIPNLGVHTSLQRAILHYSSVILDRVKLKKYKESTSSYHQIYKGDRFNLLRDSWFGYTDGISEQVRLERWKVK